MTYNYQTGLVVPFARKYYKQLILAIAAIFTATLGLMTAVSRAAEIGTGNLLAENFNTTDITTDGYAGISVGFSTEGFTDITSVSVELERADGSFVTKTGNEGVLALVNQPGPTQLTAPFVIVEGTFTEASDTFYWDPAPAEWDETTTPVAARVILTNSVGDTKTVTNETFNQGDPSWPTYESLLALIPDVDEAPSVPVNGLPNGTTLNTNEFDFTWDASTDDGAGPITYVFQSSLDSTQVDGVLTTGLWTSGVLTSPMIHSSGAADGTWYWQVKAIDEAGNESDWSEIWTVTLNTAVVEEPVFVTSKEECKNGGWVLGLEDGRKFKNQGDCVSFFATKQKNQPAGTTTETTTTRTRR